MFRHRLVNLRSKQVSRKPKASGSPLTAPWCFLPDHHRLSAAANAGGEIRPAIDAGVYFALMLRLFQPASAMFLSSDARAVLVHDLSVLVGVGGANFAMYTLWLPEQYRTECRASAFAFATSIGRFGGAGITFLVGAGVATITRSERPWRLLPLPFGRHRAIAIW